MFPKCHERDGGDLVEERQPVIVALRCDIVRKCVCSEQRFPFPGSCFRCLDPILHFLCVKIGFNRFW